MYWQDEENHLPLTKQPRSKLAFYLCPKLSDSLEEAGQTIFGSDFFVFDDDRGWVEEEPTLPLENCPFLTPYRFDLRVAGFVEKDYVSTSIGSLYGYYLEMGSLLEDILEEGTSLFHYDSISQQLSDFWGDWLEALKTDTLPDDIVYLFFERWEDEGQSCYVVKTDTGVFWLQACHIEPPFDDPSLMELLFKRLLPNYFEKHRPFEGTVGILLEKRAKHLSSDNSILREMKDDEKMEAFFQKANADIVKNPINDYFFLNLLKAG